MIARILAVMKASITKLISIAALSRRTGISIRWLHTEATQGRLPHLNADGVLLFDPTAVEQSLLQRAATPPKQIDEGGADV